MTHKILNIREITRPNGYACEGCIDWDDVNGCWMDKTEYCGRMDEEDEEEEA